MFFKKRNAEKYNAIIAAKIFLMSQYNLIDNPKINWIATKIKNTWIITDVTQTGNSYTVYLSDQLEVLKVLAPIGENGSLIEHLYSH